MAQSTAHKHDSTRRAAYQDVLDAPAHLVAEVVESRRADFACLRRAMERPARSRAPDKQEPRAMASAVFPIARAHRAPAASAIARLAEAHRPDRSAARRAAGRLLGRFPHAPSRSLRQLARVCALGRSRPPDGPRLNCTGGRRGHHFRHAGPEWCSRIYILSRCPWGNHDRHRAWLPNSTGSPPSPTTNTRSRSDGATGRA